MRNLVEVWTEEFNVIREQLIVMGGKPNCMEYNLLSCEALRLMMCINDVNAALLNKELENI